MERAQQQPLGPAEQVCLREVLEALREGVVLIERQTVLLCNAAARGMFGLNEKQTPELVDFAGLLEPIQGQDADEAIDIVIQGRKLRCHSRMIGNPPARLLALTDISEQSASEAELRRTARFLDSIVENIPDMIFVKEASELRFERFNRAGEELLGIPRCDLIGRNDYDFFPSDQADFFQNRDRQTLAGKTVVDIPEEPIETRAGVRWLHTKKIPILDESGEPRYLLGISEDISERKAAEEALLRANEELERRVSETVAALHQTQEQLLQAQKMEALGRLAGGVAHDFNNMLTVIGSYAELIANGSCDAAEGAAQIAQATARSARLTAQLLAFSRRQVLQSQLLDPNAVVRDVVSMVRPLLREDIELEITTLASGGIYADQSQLEQVILNLAVNARDAMPRGGRLSVSTRDQKVATGEVADLNAGTYLVISVGDSGVGIAPEILPRIYEPFFSTKEQGTGLGLATVHGIVHQSGGEISVESKPDQGTRFEIWLPRTEPLQPQVAASPLAQAPSPATILLTEDDPLVRGSTVAALQASGFRVLEAEDPFGALHLVKQGQSVDLLLSDVIMPGMSGTRLAELVRQIQPGIRVILMSGYTGDETIRNGVEASGLPFLQKPFRPSELIEAIRSALS